MKIPIKTWHREPSLRQTAIMQKFVRSTANREETVMSAYEQAAEVLDIFRKAGVPDPYQAAGDFFNGKIPLPKLVLTPVASAPVENLKPLVGLAETVNCDDEGEADEATELGQERVAVPVAGEETPESEPNEEDALEAAVNAAADGDEDAENDDE